MTSTSVLKHCIPTSARDYAPVQGLGKTVQVIALLAHLQEAQGIRGPFLIVCPSSVLSNWEAELHAWTPDMRVLLYQGAAPERKALLVKHVSDQAALSLLDLLSMEPDAALPSHRRCAGVVILAM